MVKNLNYLYLGDNGTILSPVKLNEILYVTKYKLLADPGKILTKDDKNFYKSIVIPESELELWKEVEDIGQK